MNDIRLKNWDFCNQRSAKKMVHKCETTVLGNGGMEFHETLTKR